MDRSNSKNNLKVNTKGPLDPQPDHSLCPKRLCQKCQDIKAPDLTPKEHKKLLEEGKPYQFLKPCCASFMVIGCSCGRLKEKVTHEVSLYWLKDAINPSID